MLSRIVNVHHVDFVGFSKGDIDYRDPEEIVMVFDSRPTFVDVVDKVRTELNWREKMMWLICKEDTMLGTIITFGGRPCLLTPRIVG